MHPPDVKLSYDKLSDGRHSVKIRLSYQGKRPRYALRSEPLLVSPADWERLYSYHQTKSGRTAEIVRRWYSQVQPDLERAQTICATLTPFTFVAFERLFYGRGEVQGGDQAPVDDVIAALEAERHRMEAQQRPGNADAFRAAAASLRRFVGGLSPTQLHDWLGHDPKLHGNVPYLRFSALSPTLLHQYEQWMLRHGRVARQVGKPDTPATLTTIGIYARAIRVVTLAAIKKEIIPASKYPFGRDGWVIPQGRNKKKALPKALIRGLIDYELVPGSREAMQRDMWVMSYLCNGINLKDLASLRWNNIDYHAGTIQFLRAKTSRTQRGNSITISATLFDETKAIIDRWAVPVAERTSTGYVFPYLTEDMDTRRKDTVVAMLINRVNGTINKLAAQLGHTGKIGTYEARHSFATLMMKAGASIGDLKSMLGHSESRSTDAYVDSIEDDELIAMRRNALL